MLNIADRPGILAVLLAVHLVTVPPAEAGTAGRQKGRDVTPIYMLPYTLLANTGYVIETTNLSAGADTVLHVNERVTGAFIDGNDDCGTRLPGCQGLRSYVSIPPASTDRLVWIMVRSYGAYYGEATLTISPGTQYQISFTGGDRHEFFGYRSGAHFFTVEEPSGVYDTVIFITSQHHGRAVKFDDDSGVARMSWIHAPEACTTACNVIIAPYMGYAAGKATFIWDEDIHDPDCDNDGMSAALEAALGTNNCVADTDGDGINDIAEVMGVDAVPSLLKFPLYGAEPLVKDVFLEADWTACVQDLAQKLDCGSVPNPDPDYYRLSGTNAVLVAQRYAPDITVHIDTGESNTDPATWYTFNNWGGATRRTKSPSDTSFCVWLEPVRVGYFHAGRLDTLTGGGVGDEPGQCFDTRSEADGVAHEMGHNFNLSHGGKNSGVDVNCKPNYLSIMNYAISGLGFSRNQLAAYPLNPMSVNETIGIGTADPMKNQHLKNDAFRHYELDPVTGAVDWNRDGIISTTPVRAALTWGWKSCDTSRFRSNEKITSGRYTNSLSRLLVGSEKRLYWFTRRESDGAIEYRYATSFPDNCGYPPPENCTTNWTPPVTQSGTVLSGTTGGADAAAATWYNHVGYGQKLLLVYKGSDSRLRYQVYFNGSWTTAAQVPGTALTVEG